VVSHHGPRSAHPHACRRDRRPATAGAACPKHGAHPHAGRDRDRRPATSGAACPKHRVDRPPGALVGWLPGDVGLRGIMWAGLTGDAGRPSRRRWRRPRSGYDVVRADVPATGAGSA